MALTQDWQQFYPDNLHRDMALTPRLMQDVLAEMVSDYGSKPAMEFDGKAMNFAKMAGEARMMAQGFIAEGVKPGARVGLFMPNCPQYLIALFALWEAGATVVPLAPTLPRAELQRRMKETEISMLVSLNLKLILPLLIAALPDDSQIKRVVVAPWRFYSGFWRKFWDFFFGGSKRHALPKGDDRFMNWKLMRKTGKNTPADLPKLDPEELALLQYGMEADDSARAAMLSHRNLTSAIDSQAAFIAGKAGSLAAFAAILPLFTAIGLISTALAGLKGGAKIAMSLTLDIPRIAKLFAKGKITGLVGPSALYAALWEQGPLLQKGKAKKVNRLMMVTDPEIDPDLAEQLEQAVDTELTLALGQGEAGGVTMVSTDDGLVPLPGLDLGDRNGQLSIAGPQVMKALYGDPQTSAALLQDGQLLTPWGTDDLPLAE